MTDCIREGTRVEVRYCLLRAEERASGLPEVTARLPYEARARGYLLGAGVLGGPAAIRTPSGRKLRGILEVVDPEDSHTFGRPHPALVEAIREIDSIKLEL